MSIPSKRLRAPNFTTGEGLKLCSIIEHYKSVIENKTTDGASLQQKQEVWYEITNLYNASGPNFIRSTESLQNCYKKLKQKAKKQHSSAKMNIPVNKENLISAVEDNGIENWDAVSTQTQMPKEDCEVAFNTLVNEAKKNDAVIKKFVMGTGGGPPCNNGDALLDKVKGLIMGSVDGMYTVFDGDSELMAECSTINPIDSAPIECSLKSTDLFTSNRSNLKRKKDVTLHSNLIDCKTPKSKKKDTVLGSFAKLAETKINFMNSQKELLSLQLKEENDKISHNRILRQMDIEAAHIKYEQEEKIRTKKMKLLDLEISLKEKQLTAHDKIRY